jgi:hypothetical protein
VHAPSDTDNFLLAADALLDDIEGSDEEVAEWRSFEIARSRAAVSRAYYAVFLKIKYRVIHLRREWREAPDTFPRFDVHSRCARALAVVRDGAALSDDLRQLSTSRKDADYEWDVPYTCEGAEAELEVARALMRRLDALTEIEWRKYANRLHEIDRRVR